MRSPEEYEAGHIPGARSAPGGQLIQSTDHYVGTRGSRIVLCDDNGVRARMTASWLIQLGWEEVFVLAGGLAACGAAMDKGPEPVELLPPEAASGVERINVLDLHRLLVVRRGRGGRPRQQPDVSASRHIPGARFAVRSRLDGRAGAGRAGAPEGQAPGADVGRRRVRSRLRRADAAAASRLPVSVSRRRHRPPGPPPDCRWPAASRT